MNMLEITSICQSHSEVIIVIRRSVPNVIINITVKSKGEPIPPKFSTNGQLMLSILTTCLIHIISRLKTNSFTSLLVIYCMNYENIHVAVLIKEFHTTTALNCQSLKLNLSRLTLLPHST